MSDILRTWGWRTWEDARGIVGDATASWLATTELVDAAPLPPDMPRTHRIHAWTREGVAWRLIPDRARGRVLVTQLAPVGRSPAHSVPATDQMDVDVEDITGAARRTRIVMGIQPLTFLLGPTIP